MTSATRRGHNHATCDQASDVAAGGAMPADDRAICAVLAAQVAAMRNLMDPAPMVDLIWRTTEVLSRLADLLADPAIPGPKTSETGDVQARVAEMSCALEEMAFVEAQSKDLARQMADCVVTALERLAEADASDGDAFSLTDLAASYVSEDQRAVHDSVTQRLGRAAPGHGATMTTSAGS